MTQTLFQLLSDLDRGTLTSRDHVEGVLDRAQQQAALNCFITLDDIGLRRAADASDARRRRGKAGLLDGVALAIKDNIDTGDLPTTAGTAAFTGPAPADAPALATLRTAGALVAGKTNLHELAFGITSNNAVFGPVRNPHDPSRIAGGSSGGTAAAIAAGIVPAGLGTDTGGSCRLPAALCGVVGFRPTTGRYPAGGIVPLSSTRDAIGLMAHTVADVTLLDKVVTGSPEATTQAADIRSIRLGVPRRILWEGLEHVVADRCEAALERLSRAGVTLVFSDPEDLWDDIAVASFPIVLFEMMRELPLYARSRQMTFDTLIAGIGSPDVRAIFESQHGDDAVSEATYRNAIDVRRPAIQTRWNAWFKKNDLHGAIFPTARLTAQSLGDDDVVLLNGNSLPSFATYARNTHHCSMMGVPGISLPLPGPGLPVGLELDGLATQDAFLLAVAATIERVLSE